MSATSREFSQKEVKLRLDFGVACEFPNQNPTIFLSFNRKFRGLRRHHLGIWFSEVMTTKLEKILISDLPLPFCACSLLSDDGKIIVDPWYDDGSDGFERCYEQCLR